jgi:hypothetical protein
VSKELHIITKEDELAKKILQLRPDEGNSIDLRTGNVDYEEVLRLVFDSDHVHVW